MGMVLAINWKLCLAMAITTVILTLVTNYIAVATLAVVTIVPIYFIYTGADVPIIVILVLLAAVIYFKHRINIRRIINGEEIKLRDSNKHRVM
jgi:glycerol-3-phosphate acyltransferase PlsY